MGGSGFHRQISHAANTGSSDSKDQRTWAHPQVAINLGKPKCPRRRRMWIVSVRSLEPDGQATRSDLSHHLRKQERKTESDAFSVPGDKRPHVDRFDAREELPHSSPSSCREPRLGCPHCARASRYPLPTADASHYRCRAPSRRAPAFLAVSSLFCCEGSATTTEKVKGDYTPRYPTRL